MECYGKGKSKVLGGNPVPVPLCPQQIPYGLVSGRTLVSAVERPATNRMSHAMVSTHEA
jgi:hypothetical protein